MSAIFITPSADDQKHIDACFIRFPEAVKNTVWEQYCLIYSGLGATQANRFLSNVDAKKWQKFNFSLSKDRLANETKQAIDKAGQGKLACAIGVKIFKREGLEPPQGKTIPSRLARMVDPDVWERKLLKLRKQLDEKVIRDAGRIYREGEPYSSNWNVSAFIQAQQDTQAFLKRQRVVSNEGDELSLADIAQSTVANPANRRHEMMTRMRGTEEIAKEMGMVCLFITFTAASIFHTKTLVGGEFVTDKQGERQRIGGTFINNPNYQKTLEIKNSKGEIEKIANTPKQSHEFIKRIVSRSISQFKRDEINYLGYKVVEPNHDGTVHWHMAFFISPNQQSQATEIFTHYALQEYGDEKGAKQHRIVIKEHDPKLGSVTGYMAKYISKGISGQDIGEDYETGLDAEDSTVRLLAWKSLWGIRQFAFYGSPSVGVWRELRRLREPLANPTAEQARLAADAGHWDIFAKLMKKNPIIIKYVPIFDKQGKVKTNKYGETVERIFGLKIFSLSGIEVLRTRLKEWFLIDLDKLEQRLIRGLPFQYREDESYLSQIKAVIQQAIDTHKVARLYQGTGGVLPFMESTFATISATPPLGLVGNKVTGDG